MPCKWFPDNLHLLRPDETLIIHTAENTSQNPGTDFIQAFVAEDGKIIALSSSEKMDMFEWQWDVKTHKKENCIP
ncbi:MAG: hypothetical protein R2941_02585 [Desulfobacterales bacterium]